MTFQITALPPEPFRDLFALSDDALAARGIERRVVDESPGFPCRVSLEDARVGETVLLLNHEHQPARTPYRASHAIFVREGAAQARPAPGEIPDAIARRLLSVRAFDASGRMTDADVVEGADAAPLIERMLADEQASYLHLHYARRGCFAARAERAPI
jgi:hypothetical protein